MSMTASRARLAALTKELSSKWERTKDFWMDAKSQEFEQRFMDELVTSVNRAVTSIQELDKIVTKVRHDCE
jgi:hypothetical protein